ncbi:ABC 3 transport family protein [uncultured archaeon]|nr:ABC 3 transport family protein [uncultured archaeon]
MIDILAYGFGQRALLAGVLVALTCSTLGVFLVLKRQSLISDGLGHVSLAGIAAGVLFGFYPIYGAIAAVFAGVFGINALRKLRIPGDAAIAILFSAGLALGVVLISASKYASADLLSYLFGAILGIGYTDVYLALGLGFAVMATIYVLFKELFAVTFDPEFARVSGLPVERLELVFTLLTGITVVISIKLVGILLVTSLIVIPAVSAMLLRLDFKNTLLAANAIAVLSVVIGLMASFYYDLASGGTIVLVSVGIFAAVLANSRIWQR